MKDRNMQTEEAAFRLGYRRSPDAPKERWKKWSFYKDIQLGLVPKPIGRIGNRYVFSEHEIELFVRGEHPIQLERAKLIEQRRRKRIKAKKQQNS